MPKVLVVSDDGYNSPGLWLAVEALRDSGLMVVAASTSECMSATSHSISLGRTYKVKIERVNDVELVVVDGSPCDALYAGLHILNHDVDLVVSGVNLGENTSLQNTLYSGTVAVAIEAHINGYKSLAFSIDTHNPKELERVVVRDLVKTIVRRAVEYVLLKGLPRSVATLNINIPLTENPRNIRVVVSRMSRLRYVQRLEIKNSTARYVSLELELKPGTDIYYLRKLKHVVILPIRLCIDAMSPCEEVDVLHLEEIARYIEEGLRDLE